MDNAAQNDIKAVFRTYIGEKFLISSGVENYGDEDSFLEKGILDSTGVLELLQFIEDTFKFRIKDEEIVPANLDSINSLVLFIQKKLGQAGS